MTKADKNRVTRKDFQSHLPRCWQCGWCFENETTKIVNYSRDFSLPFELPLSQCFGYPDQLCLRLFSSPLWANRNKREKFQLYNILCPPGGPTPFYRVLFRLKFPTASGHMITCLLMWVWFGSRSFSKDLVGHDPEPNISTRPVLPYHSINKYTVFRFCTSHYYH